MFKIVFNSILI